MDKKESYDNPEATSEKERAAAIALTQAGNKFYLATGGAENEETGRLIARGMSRRDFASLKAAVTFLSGFEDDMQKDK